MSDFLNRTGPGSVYTSARDDGTGNPVTDVHQRNAYNEKDDMMKIQSMQKKWKDSFSYPVNELNPDNWEIVQIGSGHSITVANGELAIASGVTPSTETIIRTKETFSDPFRALFGFKLSQKIANTDLILEAISVDPTTGYADGMHSVAWRLSGSDSVTTTQGVYTTQNGGLPTLSSASSTINSLTAYNILELELFADEVWYHSRGMDSPSGRANSYVRHQQIPDPNALFKVQIRVLNRAVAPVSSTIATFQFVTVVDYAELTAEITAGRGNTASGMAMSVNVTSMPTTAVTTTFASQGGTVALESTTNLTAGATYTLAVNKDMGTGGYTYTKVRLIVMHLAGLNHGHLVIEQSSDGTTWRESHRRPVPSDGQYRTYEFSWNMRYLRFKFINGATAQTGFAIGSALVRVDGSSDMDRTLAFTDSTTNLATSATFTSNILNLGGNHEYKSRTASVFASHTGNLFLEQSRDGVTFRVTKQAPIVANTLLQLTDDVVYQYLRYRVVNDATAQTSFEACSALFKG